MNEDHVARAEKIAKTKIKRSTVAEAKAEIADSPSTATFVWGTRRGDLTSGSKAEFSEFLASSNEGDALVWGT
jgi:hypothetical protein